MKHIGSHKYRYASGIKSIGSFITELLFPPSCVSCGNLMPSESEDSLCERCREKWENAKSSAQSQYGGEVVIPLEIQGKHRFLETFIASLVNYRPMTLEPGFVVQKQIIFKLKRYNFKRLINFIAEEMITLIESVTDGGFDPAKTIIVSIPRNPMNYIKSANDGVKNVAVRISEELECEYVNAFKKRMLTKEQKYLNAQARSKNGSGLYLRRAVSNKFDKHDVIIIDDVVTTGTTVSDAARILIDETRVRHVYIFSIAQSK